MTGQARQARVAPALRSSHGEGAVAAAQVHAAPGRSASGGVGRPTPSCHLRARDRSQEVHHRALRIFPEPYLPNIGACSGEASTSTRVQLNSARKCKNLNYARGVFLSTDPPQN